MFLAPRHAVHTACRAHLFLRLLRSAVTLRSMVVFCLVCCHSPLCVCVWLLACGLSYGAGFLGLHLHEAAQNTRGLCTLQVVATCTCNSSTLDCTRVRWHTALYLLGLSYRPMYPLHPSSANIGCNTV